MYTTSFGVPRFVGIYIGNLSSFLTHTSFSTSPRTHCSIALPRPFSQTDIQPGSPSNPTMIIPDGCTFLNPSSIRSLSQGSESPYNTLCSIPDAFVSPHKGFLRTEATPRFNIGDKAQFEFISSCWEDKKSSDDQLEAAYRQNRMVCAAACRQLRTFDIRLPVFGVIWTQGKVMVHVDWCVESKKNRNAPVCLPDRPHKTPHATAADVASLDTLLGGISRSKATRACTRLRWIRHGDPGEHLG
jgi:hypothetical protein